LYVQWSRDERPIWQFRSVFDVVRDPEDPPGKLESRQLERMIAATGVGRAPRVRLGGGQAQVAMLVRGDDDVDAFHLGLSVLGVAAAQVPRLRLGELRWRSATRVYPAEPGS
jgi:hypothetical protein